MRSPFECLFFFFLKGGTTKILALTAQERIASSGLLKVITCHLFFNHLQSNFFFLRVFYCPCMLLPLFDLAKWCGECLFGFTCPPTLAGLILNRDTWNLWWGKKATQHHPVWCHTCREPKPSVYLTNILMESKDICWDTLRRNEWLSLRIWVCSAVLFYFETIDTSSATDWGSAR